MKRFTFRLATVQRIRALEERLARERLIAASSERRRAESLRADAHQALREMMPSSGTATMHEFLWLDHQRERLNESLRLSEARLAVAHDAVNEARAAWTAANKRAQVLERLEQHSRAQWREETARDEQSTSDDLVNARFLLEGAQ